MWLFGGNDDESEYSEYSVDSGEYSDENLASDVSHDQVIADDVKEDVRLEEATADNHTRNHKQDDGSSSDSSMSDTSRDASTEDKVLSGELPGEVKAGVSAGYRSRTHSEVTMEGDKQSPDDNEEDERSPLSESQLSEDTNETSSQPEDHTMTDAEKYALLVLAAENDRVDILQQILTENKNLLDIYVPPLHIAVGYGSTNVAASLMRLGADPSVRPNISNMDTSQLNISHPHKYDGLSSWELVFGDNNAISISPSKREAIRHAFTAEALRCIGSDENTRLHQLLDAGMPVDTDLGGKTLYDWAVEMKATKCQQLLRPASDQDGATGDLNGSTTTSVVHRPAEESIHSLVNRIDELESLAKALSTCLDSLAEEVSVCHGLLLMGGGAAALSSHVRSLKAIKQDKEEEFYRLAEALENTQDELAYYAREGGPEAERILSQETPILVENRLSFVLDETATEDDQKRQLQLHIAALENKTRKLRVSIADLSEENTQNLVEVERRGLTGGIKIVRNLRDEIQAIEHQISQVKATEATCQFQMRAIWSNVPATKSNLSPSSKKSESRATPPEKDAVDTVTDAVDSQPSPSSKRIATGGSTAIVVRQEGRRGLFPLGLWRIFLLIIGVDEETVAPTRPSPAAAVRSRPAHPAMVL